MNTPYTYHILEEPYLELYNYKKINETYCINKTYCISEEYDLEAIDEAIDMEIEENDLQNNLNTNTMNLKQLKESKTNPKEYPFLKSVVSYIDENYKEIRNELEEQHLEEILDELSENDKNIKLAIVQDNKLTVGSSFGPAGIWVSFSEKSGKKKIEQLEDKYLVRWEIWTKSIDHDNGEGMFRKYVDISNLYYITDPKAFLQYELDCDKKRFDQEIEQMTERFNKSREDDLKKISDLSKYNLNTFDYNEIRKAKRIAALTNPKVTAEELEEVGLV